MKLNITYFFTIGSLIINMLPTSAIEINNFELNNNISTSFENHLLLANNKSNGNYLNKQQVKQYLKQYRQAKNCQIINNPKKNTNKSFTKYLFDCIGYNFEVISSQNKEPITALTVRSYPVLILQQKNRYKIKFSSEPRMTSPRPIIVWTENGANDFPDFTPLRRANIVTDKFNKHFINRGQVKVPYLSRGILNGQSVVCAAPSGNCRSDNVLWTLKKNNQKSNIINQLNDALKGNAATPLFENQDYSCVVKNENIQTRPDSVDMTSLVKKIITDEIQCVQNQESPEKIADELESSDNFEAIISDNLPMITQNPTIESPPPSPPPIQPPANKRESCWEQWDCEPTFQDLDPEFMDLDWDNF